MVVIGRSGSSQSGHARSRSPFRSGYVPSYRMFCRADENRSSKGLSDRKKCLTLFRRVRVALRLWRKSLNRESGDGPRSESGAVPAAVSLFPCTGQSEQSLSPRRGREDSPGRDEPEDLPLLPRIDASGPKRNASLSGFSGTCFHFKIFLARGEGTISFRAGDLHRAAQGVSERRFSLTSDRWGDAIAPICSHFRRRGICGSESGPACPRDGFSREGKSVRGESASPPKGKSTFRIVMLILFSI